MGKPLGSMSGCECSECGKELEVPDPTDYPDDVLEMECPHCGRPLCIDRVVYWVASGTGD